MERPLPPGGFPTLLRNCHTAFPATPWRTPKTAPAGICGASRPPAEGDSLPSRAADHNVRSNIRLSLELPHSTPRIRHEVTFISLPSALAFASQNPIDNNTMPRFPGTAGRGRPTDQIHSNASHPEIQYSPFPSSRQASDGEQSTATYRFANI